MKIGKHVRINIHAVIDSSRVNGPGSRMVIFFQGCNLRCPGCFNPDTHSFRVKRLYSPDEIFAKHLAQGAVEGITVSGGEPFLQPKGLLKLLKAAREHGLTTVVYTGYTFDELKEKPDCVPCLKHIDTLVDGRYETTHNEPTLLARGSTNQRFHFLTDRYTKADFNLPGKVEVVIAPDGTVRETGFSRFIPEMR